MKHELSCNMHDGKGPILLADLWASVDAAVETWPKVTINQLTSKALLALTYILVWACCVGDNDNMIYMNLKTLTG